MKLDGRAGVSIVELVIYFPALVVATIVCIRHGFRRSSGWIFALILCVVRIVGACCQLATYQSQSTGLLEATIILESIGISPLLLATLGLLSRCADSINNTSGAVLSALHFRVIQLGITLGLILSIVGGTNSVSPTGVYKVQATSEAAVILYIVCYIALGTVLLVTIMKSCYLISGETRIVWAVVIAMPFILVRLVYSLLVVFRVSHEFSLISGSALAHALMAVLEEMLVVLIYLGVGWTLATGAVTQTVERPIESRPWKGKGTANAKRNTGGRRQGPIHRLVGMAVETAREHRSNNNSSNNNNLGGEESV